jgi:hypothetical protein
VPACPEWRELIANLEREAGIDAGPNGEPPDAAELVRRANSAVRTLKLQGLGTLGVAVEKALVGAATEPPPQTVELARTWWPLVLTTNYDAYFLRAYTDRHRGSPMLVRGRRPQDCQDVLSSLTAPSDSVLWALQGFLAPRDIRASMSPSLSEEFVIGHEEYRRVTHREPHFRKAFAEVYRRRSLLFLGSGLKESYLLDLFGEILEFYGTNPLYHYALVKQGDVDIEFLLARFNTIVIEYADHAALPGLLGDLNREVLGRRTRTTRWGYAVCASKIAGHETEPADVSLIRGKLPLPDRAEEHEVNRCCIAISGGGGHVYGKVSLGGAMQHYVAGARKLGRIETLQPDPVDGYDHVWRYDESPLFCVVAREEDDVRDVRCISRALGELCDVASGLGYRLARVQLLSAGPGRDFPPRLSLVEMVRGYAEWRRRTGTDFSIAVHLVDPNLLYELTTGRIEVLELLTCPDVRFWVEIVMPSGELERHLQHCLPDARVAEIAERFAIPPTWNHEVGPPPSREEQPLPEPKTIASIGVVPGSTLRFFA